MTLDDWRAVIDTNLNSLFNVTKQVIDDILGARLRGVLSILVRSMVRKASLARQTTHRQSGYPRVHHGLGTRGRQQRHHREHSVTRLYWNGYGSRHSARRARKIVATIPVKRLGTPEEIASIVSWLASDESGFSTGADFSLNGAYAWAKAPCATPGVSRYYYRKPLQLPNNPNLIKSIMRLIKKYPNRRLYDTQASAYVRCPMSNSWCWITNLFRWSTQTEEDITRAILLQIILEEERGCPCSRPMSSRR